MKGSLQGLGDEHWRLRVFAGREAGKVRQVSRNFKGTKRQAESALAKLVADVERQQVAIGYAGTLGELIERWLDDIAPHRSYTIREYRRVFTKCDQTCPRWTTHRQAQRAALGRLLPEAP